MTEHTCKKCGAKADVVEMDIYYYCAKCWMIGKRFIGR